MLEKLLKLDTFKQWFEKINNIINKTNEIDKEFIDYKTNVNNKFSSDVWSKKQHNYGTIPISVLIKLHLLHILKNIMMKDFK